MSDRRIAIRLGLEGKATVTRDLDDFANSGNANARRLARGFIKADEDIVASMQRRAAIADKINAILPKTPLQRTVEANAGSSTSYRRDTGAVDGQAKSARESAAAFRELLALEQQLEARAKALVMAIDPVARAQDRFNREMGEARTLVSAGVLSLDHYVQKLAVEKAALDAVAGATDRLDDRVRAFRASIDPTIAAQDRFNAEMGEARALIAAGAITLDEYCAKLQQERNILATVEDAHKRGATSVGAHRAAVQNIGFQLQDFFIQVGGGVSILVAFAQQFPQAAGAVAGLGGKLAGVAGFMGGMWGIGITTAVAALGPFIAKLFETEKTLDDVVRKLREDAKETALAERAKERFKNSAEGVAAAIRDQAKALDQSIKSQGTAAEQANIAAKQEREKEIATRKATIAILDQVKARAAAANQVAFGAGGGAGASGAQQFYADQVTYLEKLAKEQADAILTAEKNVNGTRIALAGELADRMTDPIARIRHAYQQQEDAAKRAADREAKAGHEVGLRLARQLAAIQAERDAAIKAEQDRQREAERTGRVRRDTEAATSASIAKMLRDAIPGVHVTSTTGGKHTKNSYHYRNQAIDFVPAGGMGSMTKEDVRRIFNGRGVDIIELLGPGDKGHSDHFHVAWAKGKAALDEFADAARRAEEKAAELSALTGAYDPLAAAAERYRKVLADIERLKPENAEKLRAGARTEYLESRAKLLGDRIGIDGIDAGAKEEQAAIDRAEDRMKRLQEIRAQTVDLFLSNDDRRRNADRRAAIAEADRDKLVGDDRTSFLDGANAETEAAIIRDRTRFVADMLTGQREGLALTTEELRLAAANDNVREQSLSRLRLILDLKHAGVDLDSTEGRAILANADAHDLLIEKLREQQAAWAEINGFGEQFVDTVLSPDTWKDWGEGGKAVLKMVRDEFLKLALINPIKNMLLGENNVTLGSLLKGFTGMFGGAGAGATAGGSQGFVGPPGDAVGTHYSPGGDRVVGEFGREIVRMPRGASVVPAGETRRMLAANDSGPARVSQYFDLRGAMVNEQVYADMRAMAADAAAAGAMGGAQMAETEGMERSARRLGRGW